MREWWPTECYAPGSGDSPGRGDFAADGQHLVVEWVAPIPIAIQPEAKVFSDEMGSDEIGEVNFDGDTGKDNWLLVELQVEVRPAPRARVKTV
jgi:hypothetical protein